MKIFCSEKGHNLKVSFRNRGEGGGVWVLPYKVNGDVLLDVVAFSNHWIDDNGVAFSIELLEWGCCTFCDFLGEDSSSYLGLANVAK